MKSKKYLFVVLFSVGLMSFSLPKKLKKKVFKQIEQTFSIADFELSAITVSNDVNAKLQQKVTEDNLYKILKGETLMGYAYVAKAPSKTDEFDYLILLDKDLIITKTKVLIYREDYGGEIGSKRWLKQFIGKKPADKLMYEKDIIAISGATISASSMTVAVNTFLQDLAILHQHRVL